MAVPGIGVVWAGLRHGLARPIVGEVRYEVVRGAVECVGKPRGPRDRIIGIAGRGRIGAAAAGDIGPPSLTVIGWSDERIGAVLVCRRQPAERVIAGDRKSTRLNSSH